MSTYFGIVVIENGTCSVPLDFFRWEPCHVSCDNVHRNQLFRNKSLCIVPFYSHQTHNFAPFGANRPLVTDCETHVFICALLLHVIHSSSLMINRFMKKSILLRFSVKFIL